MKALNLNFYNFLVQVETSLDNEILNLEKNFSKFISQSKGPVDFSLKIYFQAPPIHEIPNSITSSMQTLNSICYDDGDFRYCDYYGELLVIFNKKTNSAKLYSLNSDKIHEVSYLLILSRVGKALDQKGLHKLHAFSVSYKDLAVVCMMPMKGGKSTLLMEFLKDPRFKIISDDIPLINLKGEIIPFPMKIGLNHKPTELDILDPEKNVYTMNRGHHGIKYLLSLEGLPGRIENQEKRFKKIILIEAFRYNNEVSVLTKSSFLKSFKGVFKHGIIGVGLPMVMEYFWEKGFNDFLVRAKIFLLRSWGFSALLFRARKMQLFLGKNPHQASELITDYVVKNYEEL